MSMNVSGGQEAGKEPRQGKWLWGTQGEENILYMKVMWGSSVGKLWGTVRKLRKVDPGNTKKMCKARRKTATV